VRRESYLGRAAPARSPRGSLFQKSAPARSPTDSLIRKSAPARSPTRPPNDSLCYGRPGGGAGWNSSQRYLRALLLALLLPFALGQAEPRLVPEVSNRQIEIRYSFTGEELLLYGAIIYPGGRPPQGSPTDVAVVIKGPLERIVVREKRKVMGIWMNVGRTRFRSAPAFYAVASSRPINRIVDERTAAIYELGVGNLQLSPGGGSQTEEMQRFESGLIELRRRSRLYAEYPGGVSITEGVLYTARINIPARVPVGTYTAETFLIRDGRVVAGAAREIRIEKLGFEGFVARAAERWSLAYGIAAVAVSLFLGWAASVVFARQ
jgi:uncharacterized protein (TIGR02186 family)